MTEDDYFCREETRGEGGNDCVPLGEICLRRGDCRFHDGHNCFVYINDRIRSGNDRSLLRFDDDLAEQARQSGCGCGGKLHSARYPRKPRGVPEELQEDYSRRRSFCCAEEGCRKRTTPASFRFLSRRVYVAAVVIL